MKTIFKIFLFCFSITLLSQNISGKVTYVVSMEPISEKIIDSIASKKEFKKTNMSKWMKDILKNTPDVNAFLSFSNGESLYKVEDIMQNDNDKTLNINRILAGGENIIYRNSKTKEYIKEVKREALLVTLEEKEWQITQESKYIGKYLCFKAIDIKSNSKKKPIVWFTPEIPVSFGPEEFTGLPGLVILIEMGKRFISATKININPADKVIVIKPNKGTKISNAAYFKLLMSFNRSREKKL